MLNTKYVLMFVVLSAGMLTGLTATGMSLGQTAFAEDNDKNQKIDQENKCKIEIENEHGDNNEQNNNDNEVTCQNSAQNAKNDASVNGNPFSELGPG
jgi:hypothetical protein